MKVFLTIWILAVLIQEVVPGTLVRLPRNAEKNLSLVHTEYEAKYEQKGKHGNESFSTVSGKQEIVHDNCAENWNTFAEKCAALIKDLVASLANAVSSKPGDATNLQLHIKNTFRHFDNTHNCTCLNHSGKKLSDLDLSPLFSNITIKTAQPDTKNSGTNPSENNNKKCGGTGQPCDGRQSSDEENNENVEIVSSGSNDPESDQNGYQQNHVKKCGQSGTELCDGHYDKHPEHQLPQGHQKQLNSAFIDDKDLEMNPENAEGSSDDQSTNNSRRQIMYPPNLEKPRQISKNSDHNSFSNPSQPKNTKNVRHPFLVTPRPISQSDKPSESPSISGHSRDPDSESSSVILPQENSSAPGNIPAGSSTAERNYAPSSTSSVSTSPNHRNSSPNNLYMHQPHENDTEAHSPSYYEEDPKEFSETNGPRTYQKPKYEHDVKSRSKSSTNRNSHPSVVTDAEPVTESHDSEPEMSGPTYPISRRPNVQAGDMVTDKQNSTPLKSNDQLNTHSLVTVPEDQITDNYNSAPEHSINNKQSGEPALVFREESVADKHSSHDVSNMQSPKLNAEEQSMDGYGSNSTKEIPVQSVSTEQPTIKHRERPSADSHTSGSKFIPEIKDDDQSSTPSVVYPEQYSNSKLNEQPMIVFPEKVATKNSEPGKEEPQPIVILPEESQAEDNAGDPSATDTASTMRNTLQKHPKSHNSASPVYVRHERPIEEHPDLEDDPRQPQENPAHTTNEHSTKPNHSPHSHFNSKVPESLEQTEKDQTMNPSHVETHTSGSDPSSKPLPNEDSANLSPENTHFKHTDDQIVLEQYATTCAPHGGHDLDHTVSVIHSAHKTPEVVNQQTEDSIPTEEHSHVTPTSDQSSVITHGFTVTPQKTEDEEVYDPEEGYHWNSKQLTQEPMFTSPAPNYSGNTVTAIDDNQPKPRMTAEDYDPHEKETLETESSFASMSPEDQKQPDKENVSVETQNEHRNAQIHSEMKGATPFAYYPEKSGTTEAQSAEQPAQMNGNSGFINNENQEPFVQEYFITPAPTSTAESTEIVQEHHNENMENPTNENSVLSHAPHRMPTKKSDDDENSQVTAQFDNDTKKSTKSHSDHLSHEHDHSSVPHATKHSEAKVISAEQQPETAMARPMLKPSQPGVLVSTTETEPNQEEGENILLHPTTFQTTSEEPTLAQGSSSLSHPTTSAPQDSDETIHSKSSTSPKTMSTHEHEDDDEEDCCSCESCTEEEITDPKQYRENACKNLEEARRELKAIFDKIKKKLKCGRKVPQTITAS